MEHTEYCTTNDEKRVIFNCLIDCKTGDLYGIDNKYLKSFCEQIKQSAVTVTIEPR